LLNSARGGKLLKIRKTPRSQVLAPKGSRKREYEHTHRHTLKTYVEEDRPGSGYTYAEKEGVEGDKKRRNGGRMMICHCRPRLFCLVAILKVES